MKARVKEMLRKSELFRVLPEAILTEIVDSSTIVSFPKNHFVIHERDHDNDLFFLIKGLAKITVITDDGEEFSVRFYHPGELAGLINMLAEESSRFSVQTVEDSEFLMIAKPLFNRLIHEQALFAEQLTHDISRRLHSMYQALAIETSTHHHGLETYPYRKLVG